MLRVAPTAAFVLTLAGAPAMADTVLLPDVSVHLLAAHYAPVDTDFRRVGEAGPRHEGAQERADVHLGRLLPRPARADGGVRGPGRRACAGEHAWLRRFGEQHEAAIVFSHVSRHVVDRVKVEAVDWNILGVRGAGRRAGRIPLAYTAGLGHTTLASLVGYRWEATGHLDAALVAGQKAEAYVAGDARFVTVERSDAFPRGNFLDRSAEGGVRWRRGGRSLETFAAWQRRNDVFVQRPGAWSRALFGFRRGYAGR